VSKEDISERLLPSLVYILNIFLMISASSSTISIFRVSLFFVNQYFGLHQLVKNHLLIHSSFHNMVFSIMSFLSISQIAQSKVMKKFPVGLSVSTFSSVEMNFTLWSLKN